MSVVVRFHCTFCILTKSPASHSSLMSVQSIRASICSLSPHRLCIYPSGPPSPLLSICFSQSFTHTDTHTPNCFECLDWAMQTCEFGMCDDDETPLIIFPTSISPSVNIYDDKCFSRSHCFCCRCIWWPAVIIVQLLLRVAHQSATRCLNAVK